MCQIQNPILHRLWRSAVNLKCDLAGQFTAGILKRNTQLAIDGRPDAMTDRENLVPVPLAGLDRL